MTLTQDQKQTLQSGDAVHIQEAGLDCVIVRADLYERVRPLLDGDKDWPDEDLRRLLAKSAEANGWTEPEMDAYDNYDEEIKKRCR